MHLTLSGKILLQVKKNYSAPGPVYELDDRGHTFKISLKARWKQPRLNSTLFCFWDSVSTLGIQRAHTFANPNLPPNSFVRGRLFYRIKFASSRIVRQRTSRTSSSIFFNNAHQLNHSHSSTSFLSPLIVNTCSTTRKLSPPFLDIPLVHHSTIIWYEMIEKASDWTRRDSTAERSPPNGCKGHTESATEPAHRSFWKYMSASPKINRSL